MNYKYFPHTADEIQAMLERCGENNIDGLYSDIPEQLILKREYELPSALSEKEIRDYFAELGQKNQPMKCFVGAGCYNHYSPSVIGAMLSRSEFYTSYTPYQAEISQGTLQYIFEYQSMMAELTGLEVSNASMYDGTTAAAEAVMMCVANARKKNKVLVSETVSPITLRVIKTYAQCRDIEIELIKAEDGVTSKADFEEKVAKGDVAGVLVATPNFYGIVEDYTNWADICHANKALLVMTCVASALGAVKTPGEWGADIAVGDGQSLGIPMSYGGPYVGFICTRKSLIRKMPGRVVGATKDLNGQRAFVLTLQAREQHIRREKATSNICSNQSLMALYVTIYMALMGPKGLKEVNELCYSGAHYLAEKLESTGKMHLAYDKPYLNEFVMNCDVDVDKLQAKCREKGIQAGLKISRNQLLLCVTEMLTKEDLDKFVAIVEQF